MIDDNQDVRGWKAWAEIRENSPFSWTDDALIWVWYRVMLRRYEVKHPEQLTTWRTRKNWEKLIEWQLLQDDVKPEYWQLDLSSYLTMGGNRSSSENPWAIGQRVVWSPRGYKLAEWSIRRVRGREDDIAFWMGRFVEKAQRERVSAASQLLEHDLD